MTTSDTAPDDNEAVWPHWQQTAAHALAKESACSTEHHFAWILARARQRDLEAFSLLYERYLPVVYRFTLSRVHEVTQAEDLTSETFLAVLQGITTLRHEDELGFAGWLLGIARHKIADYYRHLKAVPETLPVPPPQHQPVTVAEEGDPLAVITAREDWGEVVAALNHLTSEQRLVVLYRCLLGASAEKVGQIMGKPANAIYGLQFRALASLARHLGLADRRAKTGLMPDKARLLDGRADREP